MEPGPGQGGERGEPSAAPEGASPGTALPEQDSLTFTETLEQGLVPTLAPLQPSRPAGGSSSAAGGLAEVAEPVVLGQFSERLRHLETAFNGALSRSGEDEDALCTRLTQTLLPDVVRQVGQELRSELEAQADNLRSDLRLMSGTVTDKLRLLDEERERLRSEGSERMQATRSERSFLQEALVSPSAAARPPAITEELLPAADAAAAAAAAAAAEALAKCETVAADARLAARKAEERAEQLEWRLKELLGRGSPPRAATGLVVAASFESEGQRANEASPAADDGCEGRLRTLEMDVQALRQLFHVPGVERLVGASRRSGSAEAARTGAWDERSVMASRDRSVLLGQLADITGAGSSGTAASAADAAAGGRRASEAEAAAGEPRDLPPAATQVVDLVASLAARASHLEQQLEGGAEGEAEAAAGTPLAGATASRVARLEWRLESLASALDSLRQQVLQVERPLTSQQAREAARVVEERLQAVEEAVRKLRERDVLGLKEDVRRLRERTSKTGGRQHLFSGKSLLESDEGKGEDPRADARLAPVWKEIASNAKAAASRLELLDRGLTKRVERVEVMASKIDPIEHALLKRIEKVEAGVARLHRAGEGRTAPELCKQLEGLQWRVSWLEWSAEGEKRSFSRPVDEQAMLPSPTRALPSSQSPSPPLTEDAELWTREPNGRQRPRRRLRSQWSPQRAPSVEAISPPERRVSMRSSRSHGRLPTLKL